MADESSAWRCSACGYVHRGEHPPELCPICGAPETEFEPYLEPVSSLAQAASIHWRCLNCNYNHEGDTPPEVCPLCAAGSERFESLPDVESDMPSSTETARVVIVGAGIAGASAAEAIREASRDSSITLISQDSCLPYYRLNLTRYLAGEIDSAALTIHPESWYEENRIGLCTGRKIVAIDTKGMGVELDNGETKPYDKLILATGSHPFVPPMRGTDLEYAFTLRTAADADSILARMQSGVPCVCIGGGILGLETAGALARSGYDVTLLESHEWLMPRQLNAEAAALLESHMIDLGVKLRKCARTRELSGTRDVTGVVLQNDETIPCGMVVICTGVRPNTHLARKAGLEVNRGVVIDNFLNTSDAHILAAGDVTEHNGVVYGVWGPSQFQGTIAGLNALGKKTVFGGVPRSNSLKVLGLDMLSMGEFTPADGSYLVLREQDGSEFRHFVFHDGKMVGCILLGDTSLTTRVKHAIEGRTDFSAALAGPTTCADIIEHL